MNWCEIFEYSETSPSRLLWKLDRYMGRGKGRCFAYAGDSAGCWGIQNGWVVRVSGKLYKVHRIIVEMMIRKLEDGEVIDHINQDRADNSITNLRIVKQVVNMRNQRKSRNNTSGVTGVSFQTNTQKSGKINQYWVAYWRDLSGKLQRKSFPICKLGNDKAFALACEYRAKMIGELNFQGAGYTERHGK